MSDAREVAELAAARASVLQRIADASARAGRVAGEVTLVAVSKTVDAQRLRAAVATGLDLLGENRVQEAETKVREVPGATWHLVGPLQSNKVRRAVTTFSVIQTIDSVGIARRVAAAASEAAIAPYRVLLQVNVDSDPAKAGFAPEALVASLDELAALDNLRIEGLMTVGRLVARADDARPTFVALRTLSDQLRRRWPGLGPTLSMGMSDDYEVAVEEGATHIRIGRALFGERPSSPR